MREAIPQKFNSMMQVYLDNGKPEIEFLVPSGQLWESFDKDDRKLLSQLVKQGGQNLDVLVTEMNKMHPRRVM